MQHMTRKTVLYSQDVSDLATKIIKIDGGFAYGKYWVYIVSMYST